MTVDDDQLVRAVDRLVDQVGHWSPSRWTGGNGARADLVYALAQRLADLEAGATGRPRYPVPRLGNHLVLPDQVRSRALASSRRASGLLISHSLTPRGCAPGSPAGP